MSKTITFSEMKLEGGWLMVKPEKEDLSKHSLRAIQERMQQAYTKLIKKGMSTKEIADKLRTNESTIHYMLTKSFDDLMHLEKDLSAL